MFELQCLALRKDSKMYKDRIEAILQQLEEVAIERDQVGTSPPSTPGQGCVPPALKPRLLAFRGRALVKELVENCEQSWSDPFPHCQENHTPRASCTFRVFSTYL